jgi:hypothetical protein
MTLRVKVPAATAGTSHTMRARSALGPLARNLACIPARHTVLPCRITHRRALQWSGSRAMACVCVCECVCRYTCDTRVQPVQPVRSGDALVRTAVAPPLRSQENNPRRCTALAPAPPPESTSEQLRLSDCTRQPTSAGFGVPYQSRNGRPVCAAKDDCCVVMNFAARFAHRPQPLRICNPILSCSLCSQENGTSQSGCPSGMRCCSIWLPHPLAQSLPADTVGPVHRRILSPHALLT